MADTTEPIAVIAWVGMGSNQQEPRFQVARARSALNGLPETRLAWVSQDYLSEPIGGVAQAPFVNAVARLETRLSAAELLRALHQIEEGAGRRRAVELVWGPRVLDLDLLLYGELQSQDSGLRLPHPEIAHRAFVLRPLADYDAQMSIPGLGTIAELLPAVAEQKLWPLPAEADDSTRGLRQSC